MCAIYGRLAGNSYWAKYYSIAHIIQFMTCGDKKRDRCRVIHQQRLQ